MHLIVIDLFSLIQRRAVDARPTGSRHAAKKRAAAVTIGFENAIRTTNRGIKDALAIVLFQPCRLG